MEAVMAVNRTAPHVQAAPDWQRRLCVVADGLIVSGDLDPRRPKAINQVAGWLAAGVTDVIDVRGEWSDEELVAEFAPSIRYRHLPTHDNGGAQSDAWFAAGVTAARAAQGAGNSRVLVHCHMGINRAPSMALRIMLDRGWDVVEALDAIRAARPIAAIAYAADAVAHHHRTLGSTTALADRDHRRVRVWHRDNDIDVSTVIRLIRKAEAAA